jgi:hypothetical protein
VFGWRIRSWAFDVRRGETYSLTGARMDRQRGKTVG